MTGLMQHCGNSIANALGLLRFALSQRIDVYGIDFFKHSLQWFWNITANHNHQVEQ